MNMQMDEVDRVRLESEIATALSARDMEKVLTLALRGYGPEVLGFLHGRSIDPTLVQDIFASFCEQLWKGLPEFELRCSFRTWMYAVARRVAAQVLRGEIRQTRRNRPLMTHEEVEEQVRSATLPFLRTNVKDRFAALRSELSQEDRDLLILRVDRQMEWREIARVLSDGDGGSEEDQKREAARLRKRFQFVKDRLRELAQRERLLEE